MKHIFGDTSQYDDIIELPHHQSLRRAHMPVSDRAAQFAPFAALVGYDQLVKDTAELQLREKRVVLDEDRKHMLDEKLQIIMEHINQKPEIRLTWFDETADKLGGGYVSCNGVIKKIEAYPAKIILIGGREIFVEDILEIEGEILRKYGFI